MSHALSIRPALAFALAAVVAASSALVACTGDDNTNPAPTPDSGVSVDGGAKDSGASDGAVDGTVAEAGGDAGDSATDTGTNGDDAGDASDAGTVDASDDAADAADLDAPADG